MGGGCCDVSVPSPAEYEGPIEYPRLHEDEAEVDGSVLRGQPSECECAEGYECPDANRPAAGSYGPT